MGIQGKVMEAPANSKGATQRSATDSSSTRRHGARGSVRIKSRAETIVALGRKVTAKPLRKQPITSYFEARQNAQPDPCEVFSGKCPKGDARLMHAIVAHPGSN